MSRVWDVTWSQMLTRIAISLLVLSMAGTAGAQPVAITAEPHHHVTYSDARLRVFRVEVPAHEATLLHEHAVDYFWIAVGPSGFINSVAGKRDARVTAEDGSVHFTRGGFSHVARIEGNSAFRNVTLELLHPQVNPRNLCEQVVPVVHTDCARAEVRARADYPGTAPLPLFETDELRVTLLTIAPHAIVRIAPFANPPLLVAVDPTDGTAVTCDSAPEPGPGSPAVRSGFVVTMPKSAACTVRNTGRSPSRFLSLAFKSALP
jgi:hypothetical protein